MSPAVHDWIDKDVEVAVVSGGSGFRRTKVEFVRVERVTATQVLLPDGRRFQRVAECYEIGTGTGHKLRRPTDPDVVQAYVKGLLEGFVSEATLITTGSGATIHGMDAAGARDALNDLANKLHLALRNAEFRIANVPAAPAAGA